METKHTKGYWAWQRFGDHYCLVAQHGMREIIISANNIKDTEIPYVSMNNDGILKPIDPEHPNSKLIAAAPGLLKELNKSLNFIKEQKTYLNERLHAKFNYNAVKVANHPQMIAFDRILKELHQAMIKATE